MGWTLPPAPDQREDGAAKLSLARGAVLRRGARDDGIRGLDGAKVAVAASRQAVAGAGVRPARLVMLADRAADAEAAWPWLADLLPARGHTTPVLGFATFGGVLAALQEAATRPEPTAIVMVGEAAPPSSSDHEVYARALLAHDPGMERRIAAELLGSAGTGKIPAPASTAGERLVVEERPGKAVVLDIDHVTHKRLSKRWQALTSGKERRGDGATPLLAPAGWGVGAAVVTGSGADGAKSVKVDLIGQSWSVATSATPASGEVGDERGVARRSVALASAWLASLGAEAPQQLFVSAPSYALAEAVTVAARRHWGESGRRIMASYPDLAAGWHPALTLLDALLHGQRPTLALAFGTWPSLHAAWLR
jgi:hypothetical protein